MKTLFLSFFLLVNVFAFSQTQLKPVTWKTEYTDKGNNEGEISIIATIEDKWHIYSQRPTDAGPIPTSFTVAPNASDYAVMGKVEEEDAHEEYVPAFEAKVFVFEHKAVFKQKIKRKNVKAFTVTVALEFMSCNEMQCLPPQTINLVVQIPAATAKK